MRRAEAFELITSVWQEFEATYFSLARTQREIAIDPSIIPVGRALRPAHLRNAAANIEVTFTLRMFAEFEGVLQDYWTTAGPTAGARRMQMQTLINRVAARNRIPSPLLAESHEVRAYRNEIVHDRLRTPRITIQDCKSRLSHFISHLPSNW